MKKNIDDDNIILTATSGNDKLNKAEVGFFFLHRFSYLFFIFYCLGTHEFKSRK